MPKDYPSGATPYSPRTAYGNPYTYKNSKYKGKKKPEYKTLDSNDYRRVAARSVGNDYADSLNRRARDTKAKQTSDNYASSLSKRGSDEKKRKWCIAKGIKNAAERRAYRTNNGLYKGRYYGPDAFKGDENMRQAWKKAGKPDPKKFAEGFNKRSRAR